MTLPAIRKILFFLLLAAGHILSAAAQEKPKLPAGKPASAPENRSIFLRGEAPALDEFKRHIPPWPAMREKDVASIPLSEVRQKWTRIDGKSALMGFNFHGWEEQITAAGKKEYAAKGECLTATGDRIMKLLDLRLIPADEERLRRSFWKTYLKYTALDREQKTQKTALLQEAGKFTDEIREYGDQPAVQKDLRVRRLPGPDDLGDLPLLREPVSVELANPTPTGRKKGKLRLVDWAMTPPDVFGTWHARIRWADGLEETIWARDFIVTQPVTIRGQTMPSVSAASVYLLYFRDWAWLKQQSGEIPGKELKITALKDMLANWWLRTTVEDAQSQESMEVLSSAGLRKADRKGVKLKFPGLPPDGFKTWDDTGMDRNRIPVYDTGKYADRGGYNTPGSVAAFLLWWDSQGKPAIPQSGDLNRKTKWLHTVLSRGKGIEPQEILTRYASEQMKGGVVFHAGTDYDYLPENIVRYVAGGNAAILSLSVWRGSQRSGEYLVPLLEASSDGTAAVMVWGSKITGRWKSVELPGLRKKEKFSKEVPDQCLEFDIDNRKDLPADFLKNEQRLILGDSYHNSIIAVTPYFRDSEAPASVKK